MMPFLQSSKHQQERNRKSQEKGKGQTKSRRGSTPLKSQQLLIITYKVSTILQTPIQ